MTFRDFPLSLEQSITRTWQSKPLCKMNLLRDIFISRIYAAQRTKTWEGSEGGPQDGQRASAKSSLRLKIQHFICSSAVINRSEMSLKKG